MTADKAIEDLVRALEAAWNRHDAHAFAQAFAEDADFTNVFGMVQKGRAGIEAGHAPIFRTMFKDGRLSVTDRRLSLNMVLKIGACAASIPARPFCTMPNTLVNSASSANGAANAWASCLFHASTSAVTML